jgi:LPS-assembly protein
LTYGLKFLSHFQTIGDVRFLLGQVYSFTTPNAVIAGDGIPKGFSDVVGVLSIHPADWLDIFYRFRVRNSAFDFVFNEASLTAGPSFARIGLSYNQWKDPRLLAQKRPSKKLLGGFLHFVFVHSWHARVAQNYDIKNNHLRNIEAELAYKNDCMEIGFKLKRTFYHAKDVKPNNTYLLSIALKNIGTLLSSKPTEDFLS